MTKVVLNSAFSNDSLRNAAGASENGMKIFDNPEFGSLEVFIIDGSIYFYGAQVASTLGYSNPHKAIRDHVRDKDKLSIQLSDYQQANESFTPNMKGSSKILINEAGFYTLILRSNMPKAESFQDWVTSEVLPSIRMRGMYSVPEVNQPSVEDVVVWIKGLKSVLNLNEASVLSLFQKASVGRNLPLPDYVPSKGVLRSATDLLKANGVEMSAKAFNKIAINKGVLVEKERKSTHGIKRFKNISDGWLDFGENQVCPNNPRETQPLWYESKFGELLKRMELI